MLHYLLLGLACVAVPLCGAQDLADVDFNNSTQCVKAFEDGNNIFFNAWETLLLPLLSQSSGTRIVLIGDSNIEFYDNRAYCGETCSSHIPRSLNIGIGGSTCHQLVRIADTMAQESLLQNCDWVIFHCGQNDIEYGKCGNETSGFQRDGTTGADVFESLQRIVPSFLNANPKLRVLFVGGGLYPTAQGNPLRYPEFREFERLLQNYAIELGATQADENDNLPRLVTIDAIGALETRGNPPSVYFEDGVHFNAEGYALWHSWIEKAINTTSGPDAYCVLWRDGKCVSNSTGGAATPTQSPSQSQTPTQSPSPSQTPTQSPSQTLVPHPTPTPVASPVREY